MKSTSALIGGIIARGVVETPLRIEAVIAAVVVVNGVLRLAVVADSMIALVCGEPRSYPFILAGGQLSREFGTVCGLGVTVNAARWLVLAF